MHLIERGDETFVASARNFVLQSNLLKLDNNQLNALRYYFNSAKSFDDLEKDVKKWLDHQTKKDRDKWLMINNNIVKQFFQSWDNKIGELLEITKNKLEHHKNVESEIKRCLQDNDSPDNNKLKLVYAKNYFATIFRIYLCLKEANINEIEHKIMEAIQ